MTSLARLFLIVSFCFSPFAQAADSDPKVVENFNIERYMGFWYEIAHSPNFFQRDCERSTAQYELTDKGQVKVLNTCYKKDRDTTSIEGIATPVDPAVPAKLKVDFGFFRTGDYWVTKLDPEYQWALVSGPGKESIFILSRTVPMDEATLKNLLSEMEKEGYRIDNLIYDKYN